MDRDKHCVSMSSKYCRVFFPQQLTENIHNFLNYFLLHVTRNLHFLCHFLHISTVFWLKRGFNEELLRCDKQTVIQNLKNLLILQEIWHMLWPCPIDKLNLTVFFINTASVSETAHFHPLNGNTVLISQQPIVLWLLICTHYFSESHQDCNYLHFSNVISFLNQETNLALGAPHSLFLHCQSFLNILKSSHKGNRPKWYSCTVFS